jgi:hypothetical protein
MDNEQQDLFHALLWSDDKLNKTIKKLRTEIPSSELSVAVEIKKALNALECGLRILVRNTNIKTNKVNPAAFKEAKIEELLDDVRRIGILTRRIEKEIKDHSTMHQ